MTDLETFDTTVQKTNLWLKDLMDEEGWEDRHKAYLALRAGLHALRDSLSLKGAVRFSAQLPMLVRGFYFEGWNPSDKPERLRTRKEFLDQIAEYFPRDPEMDPERVARAVFSVLGKRISGDGIDEIKSMLPRDIRELWP
ncbi:MAG: DUF2267 domain-containing protein [Syntrophales bacterium]